MYETLNVYPVHIELYLYLPQQESLPKHTRGAVLTGSTEKGIKEE